ncbi:MAG: hypothetical protein J6B68_01755 [Lachnospiraceae bacterium]|nr:hypothetical protein [Lachnospiraceae bacterium]MBP3477572.1 hypothetical protein [Lachnospiraceae bacterium]
MERLTERNEKDSAYYYPHCFDTGCKSNCYICDFDTKVCQKLGEYEDTGLTPEQIIEIDKLYAEKCKELADIKRQLPPCRVGDTVYLRAFCAYVIAHYDRETNTSECPFEDDCEFEECSNCNERLFKTTIDGIFNNGHGWYMSLAGLSMEIPVANIGKTVFLTQAEGEEALKRMEDSDAESI